jgi:hypothetical protein
MKTKLFLLSLGLFFMASVSFAQKKAEEPRSIINGKIAIKKYYNKEELERLPKGELLVLYTERIEALVETLPYIAFATKPGVTMTTLGIPNDGDNKKMLDAKYDATSAFLASNKTFQSRILPYSDTSKLISAILFYEEILKSLHEYSEFH